MFLIILIFGCICFWGGYFLSLKSNEGIGFLSNRKTEHDKKTIEDPEDPITWDMPEFNRNHPKWIKFGRKSAENQMKKDGRTPLKRKPCYKIKSHYHGNSFHIGEEVFVVEKWKEPSHGCCKATYLMENKDGLRFNVGTCEIEII